ncbi:hypothetical protein V8D89_009856 [Ganoderma adspersum]
MERMCVTVGLVPVLGCETWFGCVSGLVCIWHSCSCVGCKVPLRWGPSCRHDDDMPKAKPTLHQCCLLRPENSTEERIQMP